MSAAARRLLSCRAAAAARTGLCKGARFATDGAAGARLTAVRACEGAARRHSASPARSPL